jgi:hypothetical protein
MACCVEILPRLLTERLRDAQQMANDQQKTSAQHIRFSGFFPNLDERTKTQLYYRTCPAIVLQMSCKTERFRVARSSFLISNSTNPTTGTNKDRGYPNIEDTSCKR